jgi:alkylhydroperoxidase/carboxymuconolactone decarboxylase family protein YurZ
MATNKNDTKPPKFYTDFLQKYPEVGAQYQKLGDTVHNQGPLNERERALVKLAISGSHLFHSALKSHIKKAVAVGVNRQEMEHVALLLLPTIGFPTMMAMLGVIEDQFSKEDSQ